VSVVERYRALFYNDWLLHQLNDAPRARRCWTLFWEELQVDAQTNLPTPLLFITYAQQFGEDKLIAKLLDWRWFDVTAFVAITDDTGEIRQAFEAIMLAGCIREAYNYVLRFGMKWIPEIGSTHVSDLVVAAEDGGAVVTCEQS
jgi:hypothetical protein